ncbi:MAG: nucleotidyltransferase family protein [Parasporobacterium sp.]|nr:nucleotidyltransferase family protein [Parasporobacterium sp.]
MNVTGIIAEYNPFHKGHEHHLKEARESLNSDYIVVVMSGNYVQRGAPTIIDKYSRAEMALKCGADLVLELPACFSTASAEYFAYGGVAILDRLNVVDNLCFGTESLDDSMDSSDRTAVIGKFADIAEVLMDEPQEYRTVLKEGLRSGLSHAAAASAAITAVLGAEYADLMEKSNNILGVEYMRAIRTLDSSIKAFPVARKLSSHKDTQITNGFSSATSIRNSIFNRYDVNSLASTVPKEVLDILADRYLVTFPIFRDDFSIILGEKLLSAANAAELTQYFGVPSDLANRFMKLRNEYRTFNQFRELVYTKNMNKATVGRALMHITLGIKESYMQMIYSSRNLNAVKVLGFRESAGPLLSEIKKKSDITMVTKLADYRPDPDDDGVDMIEQTTRTDFLYRMVAMNKYDVDIPTPYEQEIIIV